jgi:hypothetical protein
MQHGMSGIGVYWCIVEMLYEEGGYLPLEYERITFELRADNGLIKSIINDFDLFKRDDEKFWSCSVLDRLQERCDKSEKAKKSINIRWDKYRSNTNVIRTNSKRNTKEESIVKKNRIKHSKEIVNKVQFLDVVFLSDEQHKNLTEKYSADTLKECIEVLNNYKMSSGKKYVSDYHTIQGWVIKRVQDGQNRGSGTYGSSGTLTQKTGRAKSDGEPYPVDYEG